jgi:hypothetical protein
MKLLTESRHGDKSAKEFLMSMHTGRSNYRASGRKKLSITPSMALQNQQIVDKIRRQ